VCRAGKHASNSASRTHHVIVEGIGLRAVDHASHQPLVLQPEAGIQQHPVSKSDARAGCCCYTVQRDIWNTLLYLARVSRSGTEISSRPPGRRTRYHSARREENHAYQ
jgi:hypothetical protein